MKAKHLNFKIHNCVKLEANGINLLPRVDRLNAEVNNKCVKLKVVKRNKLDFIRQFLI